MRKGPNLSPVTKHVSFSPTINVVEYEKYAEPSRKWWHYAFSFAFPSEEKIVAVLLVISIAVLATLVGILLSSTVQGRAPGPNPSQITVGAFRLSPQSERNAIPVEVIGLDGQVLVAGKLGLGLPNAVGDPSECVGENPQSTCLQWDDFGRLELSDGSASNCFRAQWTSKLARELEDCFELESSVHWYGGGETYTQTWPIETNPRELSAYVTGDFLQSHESYYGGVVETYWLLSNGAAIKVDDTTPLHFSLNTTRPNQVCFVARDQAPYTQREELTLGYEWCIGNNMKETHKLAMSTFYEKPTGTPDERMLVEPLWSTWAEFKEDVNQEKVLDYARKVISYGFTKSSHIEIDDNWETCYGEEKFHPSKFQNPKAMIEEIKAMHDMRVTAWVHPFVNYDCNELFEEGLKNNYFVQNFKRKSGITWWWQGRESGLIDTTNPEAVKWWSDRLRRLQSETGLTSFKFDAGEVTWIPAAAQFNNDTTDHRLWPNEYTKSYVEACADFGGLIETRAAHRNQKLPFFVRMLDKDSRWGYDNGLQSMIPTLLHFSIVGYSFVLPDMIGGNAYGNEFASHELYVRWMQANIFMPSVQFSLVPWNIGENDAEKAKTVEICLKVLEERNKHADKLLAAARQSVLEDGVPMNRPMWWADPTDKETFAIDDQYMLGDDIVVAPVVVQGATSRRVYLPAGTWTSSRGTTHTGPGWLNNYPAPLDEVPYFVKSA